MVLKRTLVVTAYFIVVLLHSSPIAFCSEDNADVDEITTQATPETITGYCCYTINTSFLQNYKTYTYMYNIV